MEHFSYKIVLLLVLPLFLLIADRAFAENVVFSKEYIYRASEMDSKISCRAIALQEVKRALLEQLGTYLLSETVVKHYKMTKDEITTLTAGIVGAEIVREQWDGTTYFLQAKITVDPQDVATRVKVLGDDRVKTRELEESRQKAEEALKEVARLREELDHTQRQFNRQVDYSRAIQELGVDDGFSGYRFTMKDGGSFIWKHYQEAGDRYCMQQASGTICIQMNDVASIKKGEYSPDVEVISTPPLKAEDRRKAEEDWKTIQANNEKTQKTVECTRMYDELQQLRDPEKYNEQLNRYQRACAGVNLRQPADENNRLRQPKHQSSRTPRDKRQESMDVLIKKANDDSVF